MSTSTSASTAPQSPALLWPADDSTWDSPKDVVLVLHLATLASGYSPNINLAARPTPTRTSHAFLRCVEPKKPHRTGCQATLLYLEYLTKSKKGNGQCKVHLPPRSKDTQKLCDHHGQPDSGHSEFVGALDRATAPFHLTVGPRVYTKREVSMLEAGLKSTGRRAGYAIQSRHTKDVLVKCLGECEGGEPCKWQVRLVPAPAAAGGEAAGHTASEIDPVHGCTPKLATPSAPLKSVLDYFPEITLEAGLIGKSKRQQVRKKPKAKTTANTPALTPDWGTDSSDEDGVISDASLQKKCEELIKLCPPGPKLEPPAPPVASTSTSNPQPDPPKYSSSVPHPNFALAGAPTSTGPTTAVATPTESVLTPLDRSERGFSSSLSPVLSEVDDDETFDYEDEGEGTDGSVVGGRPRKKVRMEGQREGGRATRASMGGGTPKVEQDVAMQGGAFEGVGVKQEPEDVKPRPPVEASTVPDSTVASPAPPARGAEDMIMSEFLNMDPEPVPAAAAVGVPSHAKEEEGELDMDLFVDNAAPVVGVAEEGQGQGQDQVGVVSEGGESKVVVGQMMPPGEVEEMIGMEVQEGA